MILLTTIYPDPDPMIQSEECEYTLCCCVSEVCAVTTYARPHGVIGHWGQGSGQFMQGQAGWPDHQMRAKIFTTGYE